MRILFDDSSWLSDQILGFFVFGLFFSFLVGVLSKRISLVARG